MSQMIVDALQSVAIAYLAKAVMRLSDDVKGLQSRWR